MAIFKCMMCGGDLEIIEGAAVAECDYCGTKQTVPKAINENLQSLFNRANTLRIKSEFDKAEKIYEKIIQAEPTQAEAYWGLILCKYGIEYVDDPETFKKIPTCHRASYDSIIADDDYKSAIEYADMSQRAIYEEQAREIDRIQKEILALAQKEETYDVFICYKETDADGQRTQDSAIANDIYYQLTQEGFKVFYSAITLEDKLGSAYEPIIFAALNSAKVMLAIGTKPEYFNAVWVKNEWSRFLKIIKKDRAKLLIPCYRDMDAYELPEEFAHLQAQDMAKIGFINDVVRGIKKVIKKQGTEAPQGPKAEVKTAAPTTATVNIAPLLKRAFMFLEDGDWSAADEYCEKVLDQDPENAQAYLGKLMAELKVRTQEELKDCKNPFDNSKNFDKAVRFGDEKLKAFLTESADFIKQRNENERLEAIYSKAVKYMNAASDEARFKAAAIEFEKVLNYKNSAELAKKCREKAESVRLEKLYNQAVNAMNVAQTESAYKNASFIFKTIMEYKDASKLYNQCIEHATDIKNSEIYNKAMSKLQGSIFIKTRVHTLEQAAEEFQSINGWKDADERLAQCRRMIKDLKAEAEAKRLEDERREELKRKRNKRNKIIKVIVVMVIVAVIVIGSVMYSIAFNRTYAWGDYGKYIRHRELTEFVIPDDMTSIGNMEFYSCTSLTNITIPDSVTSIGSHAFHRCTSLTSVTIPDSVTSIGYGAFSDCYSLTSITIPDSVTSIGDHAFKGCTSLTSITIPNGVTSIGVSAFYDCESLTSVTIGNSVTSIGYGAFSDCYSLTSITIPDSVTSIDNHAFYSCASLTSITIPNGVTSIGYSAFNNCSNLTNITFNGTKEHWQKITKYNLWDFSTGNYTVYCTDGTIPK